MKLLKTTFNYLLGLKATYSLNKTGINNLPAFRYLTDRLIDENSYINPYITYRNSIYWTPQYYIKSNHSYEFKNKLSYFKRITKWEEKDHIALIQLILTEAIRDTTFKISYNYTCKPNEENPFNGTIPFLIYNDDKSSK